MAQFWANLNWIWHVASSYDCGPAWSIYTAANGWQALLGNSKLAVGSCNGLSAVSCGVRGNWQCTVSITYTSLYCDTLFEPSRKKVMNLILLPRFVGHFCMLDSLLLISFLCLFWKTTLQFLSSWQCISFERIFKVCCKLYKIKKVKLYSSTLNLL